MNARVYLILSGSLFGIIAILHLLRVVNGWNLVLGPWSVPMGISWGGTMVPGALCLWAFRLAKHRIGTSPP